MLFRKTAGAVAITAALAAFGPAQAAAPTNDELYRIIQDLQQEVQTLKSQLGAQKAEPAPPATAAAEPVASPVMTEAAVSKVKLGGYGELHYNNLDNETSGKDKKEIDLHRFVLFAGYDFSDDVRFVSEIEIEHLLVKDTDVTCAEGDTPADGIQGDECGKASTTKGELELEQAYLEFDLSEQQRLKAGVFLIPVGILNEIHEPTTFYGVERNPVENQIIPTTWWEGGVALGGLFGATGLSYDVAVHSGLSVPTSGGDAFKIRNGRKKVSEAPAHDLAYTARLQYAGVPGLKFGGSVQYQEDVTQNTDKSTVEAVLTELHALAQYGPVSARALWAKWDLKSPAAELADRDEQEGYYGELAFKALAKLGVFGRYAAWDNGGTGDTEIRQQNYGVNYWPVDGVVIKADYQLQSGADDFDGFNLGLGYHF